MLAELIPLALVVTLSPLSIIPAVLVLQTERPRPTSLTFLVGWLGGLLVLTAIFVAVSGLVGGLGTEAPTWSAWLRVAIGAALIVFGGYRWVTRHSNPHQMPGMKHVTEAGPAKAFVVGVVLTVANVKVLFMCAAAGLAIGTSGLGLGSGLVAAVVLFVVLAGSSVALPILAVAITGDRLEPTMERIKVWMEEHNGALVAAILVVIGLMVLYKGIKGL